MNDRFLLIVTGMSGAGKSSALHALEDLDFFCVDNLPPALLPQFTKLLNEEPQHIRQAAICVDVRGGEFFYSIFSALEQLDKQDVRYEILFLDASDEALVRRFKESRRPHPLLPNGRLLEGIEKERSKTSFLKGRADHILDTSNITPHQLVEAVQRLFMHPEEKTQLLVHIVSFGFKFGLPLDSDLLFDVRFMPNPYWVQELRDYTGLHASVIDYVMKWPVSRMFLNKLMELMDFLLPNYKLEGKNQLVIAIGCTGGRHRSVTVAEKLADELRLLGYVVDVTHRDIKKRNKDAEESEDKIIP